MHFDPKLPAALMECGTAGYASLLNNNCSTFCTYHSSTFCSYHSFYCKLQILQLIIYFSEAVALPLLFSYENFCAIPLVLTV